MDVSVTDRFFEAFDALMAMNRTKLQTFCREMDADKRNFAKKRNDTENRRVMNTSWLTFIVVNYGVSSRWLLTGRGKMFE